MSVRDKLGPAIRRPFPIVPASLVARVAKLADPTMRDAARSIVFKASGALLALAAFAVAARAMDKATFGSLIVWFNTLSFLAVVAQAGQETWIARSWYEYVDSGRDAWARGALLLSFSTAALAGTILGAGAAAAALVSGFGATFAFAAFAFVLALAIFAVAIPASRAIVGVGTGDGHGEVTWRGIILAGCVGVVVAGGSLEVSDFLLIAAAAAAVSVVLQAASVRRVLPAGVKSARAAFDLRSWRRRSGTMWISSLVDATSQYLEVILVGLVLGPAMAAGYFAAGRLAAAFAMLSGGITNYALRVVGKSFYAGRVREVQVTLRKLAGAVCLAVVVGMMGIVAVGDHLLTLFGADYAIYHTTLILFAAGTASAALGGPASAVLVLTGHERLHAVLLGSSVALRLALVAVGALWFGAVGAAFAYAVAIAASTAVLVLLSRRLVGLDPSVGSLFQRAPVETNEGN